MTLEYKMFIIIRHMSHIDADMESCTLAEYNYYLDERVLENELSVQGLYLFMSRAVFGVEAVRCPVRIESYVSERALFVVKFSLLSQTLKPVLSLSGTMADGMLSGNGKANNLIEASYFRESGLVDLDDESGSSIQENVGHTTQIKQPEQVLIAA